MSAPVAIPRRALASTPGSPASSSSSGLYVPVHRRAPSSPHSRASPELYHPAHATIPPARTYSVPALLALAASPLVPHALSPAQRARIEALRPAMTRKATSAAPPVPAATTTPAPAAAAAQPTTTATTPAPQRTQATPPERRRPARAGRRNSTAKKLQAPADRRKRATWGWAEHAPEGGWRRAAAAEVQV